MTTFSYYSGGDGANMTQQRKMARPQRAGNDGLWTQGSGNPQGHPLQVSHGKLVRTVGNLPLDDGDSYRRYTEHLQRLRREANMRYFGN